VVDGATACAEPQVQGGTVMAQSHILVGAGEGVAEPTIRRIGPADLMSALAKGLDDFSATPSHALFLCVIYPVVGLLLEGRASP
jgi:uncharacterized membrane protein